MSLNVPYCSAGAFLCLSYAHVSRAFSVLKNKILSLNHSSCSFFWLVSSAAGVMRVTGGLHARGTVGEGLFRRCLDAANSWSSLMLLRADLMIRGLMTQGTLNQLSPHVCSAQARLLNTNISSERLLMHVVMRGKTRTDL
jgi:hypothetical protein